MINTTTTLLLQAVDDFKKERSKRFKPDPITKAGVERVVKSLRSWYRRKHKEQTERIRLHTPCCKNETRNMNGGCDNCGDPSW